MKVDIITFHFVNNFGGALQAYALQKTIAGECGADVEIIDYRNWFIRFTDTVRLFPITTNLKELWSGLQTMRQRLGRLGKFRQFVRQNFALSKYYPSARALGKKPPAADKYVCGSDQIWNPVITLGVTPPYFLGFVEERAKKIAYAPSFGSSTVGKRYFPKISKYLSSFGALSVREQPGVELVQALTGRKAECLIDPTFLLPKGEWEKAASAPVTRGPYMLLYIMQRDEGVYAHARELKERTGLRLVEISRYGFNPGFVDETVIDIGPAEFLSLFKNAEYVFTNSYHGFVFSVLFEKRFCIVPCKRFRTRLYSLADLLGIKLSEAGPGFEATETLYDKQKAAQIIKSEREKSIRYLKMHLAASG